MVATFHGSQGSLPNQSDVLHSCDWVIFRSNTRMRVLTWTRRALHNNSPLMGRFKSVPAWGMFWPEYYSLWSLSTRVISLVTMRHWWLQRARRWKKSDLTALASTDRNLYLKKTYLKATVARTTNARRTVHPKIITPRVNLQRIILGRRPNLNLSEVQPSSD